MKKLYKLRFTLKQVVSMIHFQGDESNSTIRATDLKPKLDRFIYHFYVYKNNKDDKNDKIEWTNKFELSDEKNKINKVLSHMNESLKKDILLDFKYMKNFALNYKVKIKVGKECSKEESSLILNENKKSIEYVGAAKYIMREKKGKDGRFSRGEPTDVHKTGKKYEEVYVDIICSNAQLAELIIEAMPYFIISTGFGYASGKGYGSFMVTKVEEITTKNFQSQCEDSNNKLSNVEELLTVYKDVMNYTTSKKPKDKIKDAILIYELVEGNNRIFCDNELECLNIIDQYNHFIKSGTNVYAKNEKDKIVQVYYTDSPLMKGYFGENGKTNEKKAMKQKLILNGYELKGDNLDKSYCNFKETLYTRGLFGFAQEYSFLIWDKFNNKYKLRPFNVKSKVKLNDKEVIVNRFHNPVSFRILYQCGKYKIYMIVNQAELITLQKLNPSFQFSFKKKKEEIKDPKKKVEFINLHATLPSDTLFSIKTFIDEYLVQNKGNSVFKYKKNNLEYCDGIKLIEFNKKGD